MVGRLGLEPRTHGLKVRCSTIELTPRVGNYVTDLQACAAGGVPARPTICQAVPKNVMT
jgi:hypothetical protein